MFVVTYRKLFFALSAALIILSVFAMFTFGFNFGIDFKGGTLTQVTYPQGRPAQEDVKASLDKLGFKNFSDAVVQPTGTNSYIIRTRELSVDPKNDEKTIVLSALSDNGKREMTLDNYNSIGPVVGNELKKKAYTAIAIVILCIVLFVTYAFRKVSQPVASWKFGLA